MGRVSARAPLRERFAGQPLWGISAMVPKTIVDMLDEELVRWRKRWDCRGPAPTRSDVIREVLGNWARRRKT